MNMNRNPKFVKLCRRMKFFTRFCQFTILGGLLYKAWYSVAKPNAFSDEVASKLVESVDVNLTPATITLLICFMALATMLALLGLQNVWRIFDQLESESPLSLEIATLIRQTGIYVIADAIITILDQPVTTVLATFANEPGDRRVSIYLSSDQLLLLLIAGLLFVFGHVLVIATAVNEDYRQLIRTMPGTATTDRSR